jgi:hypothetical protein
MRARPGAVAVLGVASRHTFTRTVRMGASILPSLLAASAAAARERAVLDAFDAARAGAPARAVPLTALPPLDPDVLAALIERGAVREGAPGTFYRFVSSRPAQSSRARPWFAVLVLVLAVLGAVGVGLLVRAKGAR